MQIQINNNIDEVKPKVMGPFTGIQLICLVIAVVIEALGVMIISRIAPNSMVKYILPMPFALFPIALGWADEFVHMPLQDYINLVVKRHMSHPEFRPFAIHNFLETQEAKILAAEKERDKSKTTKTACKKQTNATAVIPPELTRYN